MARRDQSDLHELVGAYALDAIEGEEVLEFERHLETCPRCRAELRDHRDTASFLAHAGETAPDSVWERIATQLDEAPPDIARVLPFARKRRRWIPIVSIAAALLVAVNSAVLVQQRREIRDLRPTGAANLQALAERALETPGAQRTEFLGPDGAVLADAVVTPGGQGYLVHMSMHTLDGDHTYQLWGLTTTGDMVSLGVLGGHPKVASFTAGLTITKLAVTIESAHGAVAPTTSPLVIGTLRRT